MTRITATAKVILAAARGHPSLFGLFRLYRTHSDRWWLFGNAPPMPRCCWLKQPSRPATRSTNKPSGTNSWNATDET